MNKTLPTYRKGQLVVVTDGFNGGCGTAYVAPGCIIKINEKPDPQRNYIGVNTGPDTHSECLKESIRPLQGAERLIAAKVFKAAVSNDIPMSIRDYKMDLM